MDPFTYHSRISRSSYSVAEWVFESHVVCKSTVLPDGCRDFIVQDTPFETGSWFISDLSRTAYEVSTEENRRMRGIRLKPGTELMEAELTDWLQHRDPAELLESDKLNEFCIHTPNLNEALECLATGENTVDHVASRLGVSLRSLQRLVKAKSGHSPYFWFSLARVRRAGRSLSSYDSLSDAAAEFGFSDQAHMSREMKKWFGRTPNQIKVDPELRSLLAEPGYG